MKLPSWNREALIKGIKMIKKDRIAIATILLSLTTITSATNWGYLGSTDKSSLYIDADSIKHGKTTTAWIKEQFGISYGDYGGYKVGLGDHIKILQHAKCAENVIWHSYAILYVNNVPTPNRPSSVTYLPVVPDTTGEGIFNAMCYKPSSKAKPTIEH